MNTPGSAAQLAAKEALANVGVHEEGGENRGKYVETYLRSVGLSAGAPWCASFVYYRLLQACHKLNVNPKPAPPKSGYCPKPALLHVSNKLSIFIRELHA